MEIPSNHTLNRSGDAELRLLVFLAEVGNIRAAFQP